MYNLSSVLLAGGKSSRYGANKLVSIHPSGEPLVQFAYEQLTVCSNDQAVVVTGRWHSELLSLFEMTLCGKQSELVFNPEWEMGLASSIRAGVLRVLKLFPNTTHILITLGDLPCVTTASLNRLSASSKSAPNAIVCSEFAEQVGVPAIFPVRYAKALCALQGDKGAKGLIVNAYNQGQALISVPHPEAAFDIDGPNDWSATKNGIFWD